MGIMEVLSIPFNSPSESGMGAKDGSVACAAVVDMDADCLTVNGDATPSEGFTEDTVAILARSSSSRRGSIWFESSVITNFLANTTSLTALGSILTGDANICKHDLVNLDYLSPQWHCSKQSELYVVGLRYVSAGSQALDWVT
ncbi:hypothetical protein VNO77_22535 [Canavalia gladiata]|uniref:Uncharacterized protein n=1 Tax=Canavalia gladiata TaxID=3824 RepID=A0AAN9QB36_CANGL